MPANRARNGGRIGVVAWCRSQAGDQAMSTQTSSGRCSDLCKLVDGIPAHHRIRQRGQRERHGFLWSAA